MNLSAGHSFCAHLGAGGEGQGAPLLPFPWSNSRTDLERSALAPSCNELFTGFRTVLFDMVLRTVLVGVADRLLVLELKVAEEAGPELRCQVLVLDELRRRAHVVEG